VTDFADRHPGGKDFLLATIGRDSTAMFESLHDPKAIKVLAYVHPDSQNVVWHELAVR
jgi:cytochrome b involved in lipid metabolism